MVDQTVEAPPEESAVAQEEAQSPPPAETVAIHEATDEDLEAFLASQGEEEPDEEPAPKAAAPEKPAPEAPKEAPKEEPKQLSSDEIKARAVGLIRQVEGQERLVQNQISRLAEFKKELRTKIDALSSGLEDKYLENPRGAFKDEVAIKEATDTIGLIDQETTKLERRGNTVKVLAQHLKPDEWSEPDITQALLDDGIPSEQARAFVADPLSFNAEPPLLIQLARRARAEKALRVIVPAFEQMRAENEALKAKLSNATSDVLKNVEAAASAPPRLNGKSGTRAPKKPTFEDPSTLTDEELQELLAHAD